MKIICDNCRTKYSIADEKVRGKVFKIRCKKCQNIIVVRGTQQEDPAPAQQEQDGYGDEDQGDTPVWHMVIDREQVGPMTVPEVRDRYASGDINEETYIWREGMGSWQRLGSTEEFVEMCQATKVASPAALTGADPAMGGAEAASDAGFGSDDQWGQAQAPEQDAAWGAGADADAGDANPAWGAEPEQPAASGAEPAWGAEPEQPAATGEPAWGAEPEQPAEQPAEDPAQLAYSTLAQDEERDLFATYHGDDGLLPVQPGAGADMFGAAEAQAEPQNEVVIHSGQEAAGGGMTGARNENSVLFSLSNLQDLAMGKSAEPVSVGASALASAAPAPEGGGEAGSGLIDIRAMASLSAPMAASDDGGFDDIPALGSFSSPVTAAPVLMPTVEDEKPKWVLPLVIGMAFVLVGLVGLVVYLAVFRTPTPTTKYASNTTNNPASSSDDADEEDTKKAEAPKTEEVKKAGEPGAKTAEETGDKPTPPADPAGDTKPEDKASTEAAEPAKAKAGKRRRGGRKKKRGGRTRNTTRTASAGLPSPAPGRRAAASGKRGKKRDSLDDLIDGALTGGKKKPRKKKAAAPAASSENLPDTLTKSQIQGGMRKTKTRVQACYDRFKVPGLARVSMTIGRKGKVTAAKVKGVFAGTPTGDCVKKATRGARFPKFKGSPITFTYPFILR